MNKREIIREQIKRYATALSDHVVDQMTANIAEALRIPQDVPTPGEIFARGVFIESDGDTEYIVIDGPGLAASCRIEIHNIGYLRTAIAAIIDSQRKAAVDQFRENIVKYAHSTGAKYLSIDKLLEFIK